MGLLESLSSMHKNKALVIPYGSVPAKTYLPDGDLDIAVIFLTDGGNRKKNSSFNQSRQEASETQQTMTFYQSLKSLEKVRDNSELYGHKISNVQFIKAKINLITLRVDDYKIDISFKKHMGMCKFILFEEIDNEFSSLVQQSEAHIVKNYVILVKAWFTYEARAVGGNKGFFSSYSLEILVVHVLNIFWKEISTPGCFLKKFFEYFSSFPWKTHMITLYSAPSKDATKIRHKQLGRLPISPKKVESWLSRNSIRLPGKNKFLFGCICVQDPLNHSNNVSVTINSNTFERVQKVFQQGHAKMEKLLSKDYSGVEDPVAYCKKELFPCTQWVLDRCKELEREHYRKIFPDEDVEINVDNSDILSGNVQQLSWYVKQFKLFPPQGPRF